MKKTLLALTLAVLLFVGFAGCTAGQMPPAETTAAPATAAPTPATVAPAPATVAPPETTAAPETTARPAPMTTWSPETTASPMLTSTHRADIEAAWGALGKTDFPASSSWPIDLICAILEGNGAEMASVLGLDPNIDRGVYAAFDGMVVSGWQLEAVEITRTFYTVDPPPVQTRCLPVLTLTVEAGGNDILGPGTHRLVFDEGLIRTCTPYDAFLQLGGTPPSEAMRYVDTYIGPVSYSREGFIVARLNHLTGEYGAYPAEEIYAYAAEYLGLTQAELDLTHLQPAEGGYALIGMGGSSPVHDIVSEEVRDGLTVVTVQFWADCSRLVKSKTVEYHLAQGPRDFILSGIMTYNDTGLGTRYIST